MGLFIKTGRWKAKKLYENTETIIDIMRKRRLKFYGS